MSISRVESLEGEWYVYYPNRNVIAVNGLDVDISNYQIVFMGDDIILERDLNNVSNYTRQQPYFETYQLSRQTGALEPIERGVIGKIFGKPAEFFNFELFIDGQQTPFLDWKSNQPLDNVTEDFDEYICTRVTLSEFAGSPVISLAVYGTKNYEEFDRWIGPYTEKELEIKRYVIYFDGERFRYAEAHINVVRGHLLNHLYNNLRIYQSMSDALEQTNGKELVEDIISATEVLEVWQPDYGSYRGVIEEIPAMQGVVDVARGTSDELIRSMLTVVIEELASDFRRQYNSRLSTNEIVSKY